MAAGGCELLKTTNLLFADPRAASGAVGAIRMGSNPIFINNHVLLIQCDSFWAIFGLMVLSWSRNLNVYAFPTADNVVR